MRLLYCKTCEDVVRLARRDEDRHCECGRSFGRMVDHGVVVVGGPSLVLGVTEPQLLRAVNNVPATGEGPRFFAFVMPSNSPTVRKEEVHAV